MSKFKVGDKAKVINRIYNHNFSLGSIVEITEVIVHDSFNRPLYYRAKGGLFSNQWYVNVGDISSLELPNLYE